VKNIIVEIEIFSQVSILETLNNNPTIIILNLNCVIYAYFSQSDYCWLMLPPIKEL